MKIAFLIMVHNNPTMLNCFIKQLLQYQGSVVFIHVDEKGLNIIPDIIEDPRVIIIPEHYNGSWGDYSQIQMVNALIKNAVNSGDFDYYSLHSGVDLCVREVSEFADYLSKNNLYGFYECTKLPSTWQYGGGLGRVALKWPKYLRRRAVGYQLPRVLRAIYGRLFSVGIIKGRKIPEKYELFGGSAWFTIRSDCAKDYVHFLEDSEFTSAVGEYVCFIDSDDWIHEQFFTYLHRAITENAADIALCDFKRCDESYLFPQPKYDCENLSIYNLMTNQNYKNFINKLFRHTVISNEHFMSGKVIEDAIYIIDILTKNPNVRIVKVNCTLYAYFQRSGSLVSGISVDLVRHLADYTMQKLVNLEDENLKGILAEDVIKRMLYVRYYYLLKKERIAAAECNEVIRSMLTLLSHRKVKYVVLYLIPELYRQFRLRNDPSMKTFEKNVKSSDH